MGTERNPSETWTVTEAVETKTQEAKEKKEKLFSTPQLIAGAMAASTSAILGSQLGVAGTVGGAAIGSVATAVATGLYRAGIDKTRDGLVRFTKASAAQIKAIQPAATAVAAVEPIDYEPDTIAASPTIDSTPTTVFAAASTPTLTPKLQRTHRRPRWVMATAAGLASAAAAFALAIGGITAYEAIAGQNLSGGHGTSIGQVARPAPDRTTDKPAPGNSPSPKPSESTSTQFEAPSPEPTQSTTESQPPSPEPTSSSTTTEPEPEQSQPQTEAPEPAPTQS